jgi:SHS2 domain-containing protein
MLEAYYQGEIWSVCAGGDTLGDAMAENALAMFGYMTEPDSVHIQKDLSRIVEASGESTKDGDGVIGM